MIMSKVFFERTLVALDVGTTKICALVAQQKESGTLEIIGIGRSPSQGLKKGIVVNVSQTVQSIRAALKEAELMAGISIESVYVGISGSHIRSMNSQGVVPVKKGQVSVNDITNALAAAQAIRVPEGQQVLQILPHYFVIDGQSMVRDPIGMHGIRLEVQAHIIMGATTSVQNLIECCNLAGVRVQDIFLEQIASAQAVLSPDEQELGATIIDIGGGTSDVALYQHGGIAYTSVLPVAGNQFTNDIAVCLRTTLECAERIKRQYAHVLEQSDDDEKLVEIEEIQGHSTHLVPVSKISEIVRPRAQEAFKLINKELNQNGLRNYMMAGIVLSGGGSLLRGMQQLAQNIFGVSVRIGAPNALYDIPESLRSPVYATVYGLLLCAHTRQEKASLLHNQEPVAKRIFSSMKSWIADFF